MSSVTAHSEGCRIGTPLSKLRHINKLQQVKWCQKNSKFDSTAQDLVRPFQKIRLKEELYRDIKISRCVKDEGKQSDKVMPFLNTIIAMFLYIPLARESNCLAI